MDTIKQQNCKKHLEAVIKTAEQVLIKDYYEPSELNQLIKSLTYLLEIANGL